MNILEKPDKLTLDFTFITPFAAIFIIFLKKFAYFTKFGAKRAQNCQNVACLKGYFSKLEKACDLRSRLWKVLDIMSKR